MSNVIVEERNPAEVTHLGGRQVAASGVSVLNPAFDATPLSYVAGIITEDQVYGKEDFAKFKAGGLP
jgi:methylthioribose-1-phosphate isomerase